MRCTGVTTNSPSISSCRSPSCSSGISSRSSKVSRLAVVAMRFPRGAVRFQLVDAFKHRLNGKSKLRRNPGLDRTALSERDGLESGANQPEHRNGAGVRIDDPVLLHAEPGIKITLDRQI